MRILLRDPIIVAADPHIVLVVEVTVVNAARNYLRISPQIDDISLRIEFDNRGSGFPQFFFPVGHAVRISHAARDEYMILRIYALAAYRPGHPVVGQRLGPE